MRGMWADYLCLLIANYFSLFELGVPYWSLLSNLEGLLPFL